MSRIRMLGFRGTMLVVGLGLLTGADLIRPHTRPGCRDGIPPADYQQGGPFRHGEIITETGVLLPNQYQTFQTPEGKLARMRLPRIRYFQLDQDHLKVVYCFLGKIEIMVHEDGRWSMSCRADQNPWFTSEPRGLPALKLSSPIVQQETTYLKRNEFQVRLDCLGAFPLREDPSVRGNGKPLLVRLCPEPFMVQRGQPLNYYVQGVHPDLPRYFELIDRVAVGLVIK